MGVRGRVMDNIEGEGLVEGVRGNRQRTERLIDSSTTAVPFPPQQLPWKASFFRHCADQCSSFRPGSSPGGIFPIISRINHSCRPNTQHTWNSLKKQETNHAISIIKKGEEITISYNFGGPSERRRLRMKESFNFDCTCDICS